MRKKTAPPQESGNVLKWLLLSLILLIQAQADADPSPQAVRVGIYDFPPLVSQGTTGNPQGIFIDALNRMAKRQRWNLVFLKGARESLIQHLQAGSIDLMLVTRQDQQPHPELLFSEEPLMRDWMQIFVPKRSTVQSITDLDGKRIAVLERDDYLRGEAALREQCRAFVIECRIYKYPNYPAAMKAVAEDEADAVLISRIYGSAEAPHHSLQPRPIMMTPTVIRIAVSPASLDAVELRGKVDEELREMKADSWSIYWKWNHFLFGKQQDAPLKISTILKWMTVALFTALLLFLFSHLLKFHIRRETRRLMRSEARCRTFFDKASTPLLECDASHFIRRYRQLKKLGITDFDTHFTNAPNELLKWLGEIRINKANPAALTLFEVKTRETLQQWLPNALPPSTLKLIRYLLSHPPQQQTFSWETQLITPKGHLILGIISFPIPGRGRATMYLPVSIVRAIPQRGPESATEQSPTPQGS